jgi:hypothetical protein
MAKLSLAPNMPNMMERDQPGGHGATAQEVVSVEPGHAM